jgi:hypothetical protein
VIVLQVEKYYTTNSLLDFITRVNNGLNRISRVRDVEANTFLSFFHNLHSTIRERVYSLLKF